MEPLSSNGTVENILNERQGTHGDFSAGWGCRADPEEDHAADAELGEA